MAGSASPGPSPEIRQFIEDLGLQYEAEGIPRMAGRLLGWLLICEPPLQTAAELAEVLGASAGSISPATKTLLQLGMVERVGIPGQRSDAFRLVACAGAEHLRRLLVRAGNRRRLIEHGVELVEEQGSEAAPRLRTHLAFLQFIERELPPLINRWERESVA